MRFHRPALAVIFAVALATFVLAGCAILSPAEPPDPLADYRPALNPEFPVSADLLDALSQYSITVKVDPAARAYTGTMELTLPVTRTAPLSELYFRLYPNLYHFGGSMQVNGVRMGDKALNYDYAVDGTALRVNLPEPIQPGEPVAVQMDFAMKQVRENQPGAYTIFGANDGVLTLTNFYPILAGRRNGGEWALDIPHPQGDVGFHDAAFYRVNVTAPSDQVIAATGTVVTSTQTADGSTTTRYVLGPAREFSMLMSPDFKVEEAEALGTRVRAYFRPEDQANARSALYGAVAALQVYNDRFGPYPYSEMAVVQAPLTYHGMEFPGMNLIGGQTYNRFLQDLELLTVHEVAHQWWYNQVGSDQITTPWLDEGLAEFTTQYYYRDRYGDAEADQLARARWAAPVAAAQQLGRDAPIGKPVRDYKSNYETMVYGKGALFFATLREELGAETFDRLLRKYLERYRWKIATPADFQALAEELSGRDLDALFDEWVYGE
jgi:aminopeptidase N